MIAQDRIAPRTTVGRSILCANLNIASTIRHIPAIARTIGAGLPSQPAPSPQHGDTSPRVPLSNSSTATTGAPSGKLRIRVRSLPATEVGAALLH